MFTTLIVHKVFTLARLKKSQNSLNTHFSQGLTRYSSHLNPLILPSSTASSTFTSLNKGFAYTSTTTNSPIVSPPPKSLATQHTSQNPVKNSPWPKYKLGPRSTFVTIVINVIHQLINIVINIFLLANDEEEPNNLTKIDMPSSTAPTSELPLTRLFYSNLSSSSKAIIFYDLSGNLKVASLTYSSSMEMSNISLIQKQPNDCSVIFTSQIHSILLQPMAKPLQPIFHPIFYLDNAKHIILYTNENPSSRRM